MLHVPDVILVFCLSASFNQSDRNVIYSEAVVDGGQFKKLTRLFI